MLNITVFRSLPAICRFTLVGAVLAALPLSASSCVEQSCTLVGCSDGVYADTLLSLDPSQPAELSVEVCVSGSCSAGSIVSTATGPTSTSASADLSGDVNVAMGIWRQVDPSAPPTPWTLTVSFPQAPESGSVIEIRVRDTLADEMLVDVVQTLAFEDYYPNGESCGPACKGSNLSLEAD